MKKMLRIFEGLKFKIYYYLSDTPEAKNEFKSKIISNKTKMLTNITDTHKDFEDDEDYEDYEHSLSYILFKWKGKMI
jgi:hypothetical protein